MTNCPCCSGVLLRHVRHDGVYWFCMHCWQEMPDLSSDVLARAKSMPQAHYRSAPKSLAGDRGLSRMPDHQSESSTTEKRDLLVEQRSLATYCSLSRMPNQQSESLMIERHSLLVEQRSLVIYP